MDDDNYQRNIKLKKNKRLKRRRDRILADIEDLQQLKIKNAKIGKRPLFIAKEKLCLGMITLLEQP